MNITLHTQREETIGEAAAHYARTLHTALLAAGTPGRLTTGQHHPDSPAAQEGPHAVWPFVSLRVGGRDVQTFCVPTGTGIVLILRTWTASCAACPPGVPLPVRSVQRRSPLPARSPPTRTTNDKYPLHP